MVLVGAEGVVENGGVINKLGTYQAALSAHCHNTPFYVAAESYKVPLHPLHHMTRLCSSSPELSLQLHGKVIPVWHAACASSQAVILTAELTQPAVVWSSDCWCVLAAVCAIVSSWAA